MCTSTAKLSWLLETLDLISAAEDKQGLEQQQQARTADCKPPLCSVHDAVAVSRQACLSWHGHAIAMTWVHIVFK